jgi:anti-anti-sigma regulatory factor
VVDLSGVDIVTTPAISMFLAATVLVKRSGGRIIFTRSQPPVSQVLQRLKLHGVLQTALNLDEAIAQVRQPE